MIKGIKFASIATTNQDRAVEFWTKQVGFRVLTDQPFDDRQRWIEIGIPGADTKLVLFAMEDQQPGGFTNIAFWTDDVHKTYEEMKSKGVEFIQEPQTADWGTAAIFKDSDGNAFALGTK